MRSGRLGRAGFMLAEAVASAALLLLIVQACWWMIAVQASVAVRVSRGAQALDETRLARHVLAAEVGAGAQGEDWALVGRELRLRAFRGIAFSCRGQPASAWGVAWSGHRDPNSAKDSVLVLSGDGRWQAAELVRTRRRQSLDCPDLHGFERQLWTLDPAPQSPVAALFFERGAYRFSDEAFRYRAGSRWQPLASGAFDADSTTMEAGPGGSLRVRVKGESGALGPARRWTLWGRG